MSIFRICPNCFKRDDMGIDFGRNREVPIEFLQEKWCDCGYNSPEEMMEGKDMAFTDPRWYFISKYFVERYNSQIKLDEKPSLEDAQRVFLKLLKDAAKSVLTPLELGPLQEIEIPPVNENPKTSVWNF